jgi:hypothetical protein
MTAKNDPFLYLFNMPILNKPDKPPIFGLLLFHYLGKGWRKVIGDEINPNLFRLL